MQTPTLNIRARISTILRKPEERDVADEHSIKEWAGGIAAAIVALYAGWRKLNSGTKSSSVDELDDKLNEFMEHAETQFQSLRGDLANYERRMDRADDREQERFDILADKIDRAAELFSSAFGDLQRAVRGLRGRDRSELPPSG